MRMFTVYRPNAPETHGADRKNAPDQPQYQGVVFDSGKCVIHWLTSAKSVSVFDSYEEMWRIHGHPEYGTIIKWHDEPEKMSDADQQEAELYSLGNVLLSEHRTGKIDLNKGKK